MTNKKQRQTHQPTVTSEDLSMDDNAALQDIEKLLKSHKKLKKSLKKVRKKIKTIKNGIQA
jgi:predicted transcriptional regulator